MGAAPKRLFCIARIAIGVYITAGVYGLRRKVCTIHAALWRVQAGANTSQDENCKYYARNQDEVSISWDIYIYMR